MMKKNFRHTFFAGLTVILLIFFCFYVNFLSVSRLLPVSTFYLSSVIFVICECSVLLGVTKQHFMFLFHFGRLTVAVKSIKRQHLVEVRSMANPPVLVKLALESICLLLGENASDWKSIRAVIMRDNFINTIVSNFSTEDIK